MWDRLLIYRKLTAVLSVSIVEKVENHMKEKEADNMSNDLLYKKQWQKVLGLASYTCMRSVNVDSMQEWNVKKDMWNTSIQKFDLAENVACIGK